MLRSFSRLCSSPMSIMMSSKRPALERSLTGMGRPIWSMYWSRPTVFRHTDLPPALGPEMIRMRPSLVSVISRGMMRCGLLSRGSSSSSVEGRVSASARSIQSMTGVSATWGAVARIESANWSLAWMRSIWARKS